jgi:hypothetical protein
MSGSARLTRGRPRTGFRRHRTVFGTVHFCIRPCHPGAPCSSGPWQNALDRDRPLRAAVGIFCAGPASPAHIRLAARSADTSWCAFVVRPVHQKNRALPSCTSSVRTDSPFASLCNPARHNPFRARVMHNHQGRNHMSKPKKQTFSKVKAVKANARTRVGTPPPERVLPDPKQKLAAKPKHKTTLADLLSTVDGAS